MKETAKIDLEKARSSREAKVFSGREKGKYWREYFKLDQLDENADKIEVVIPEDIFAINLSFFLSLFGESVRHLGREGFVEKYKFVADPVLQPLIEQGINQALKRSSALPEIA